MEERHCTQRRGEKEETEIRNVDVETDSGSWEQKERPEEHREGIMVTMGEDSTMRKDRMMGEDIMMSEDRTMSGDSIIGEDSTMSEDS